MFKLLDPDGLFGRTMDAVLKLIILNLCFLLCALPLVTLGASATALSASLLRLRRGEDEHIVRHFFAAFRENFLSATAQWLVLLAALGVCYLDFVLATQADFTLGRILALAGAIAVAMAATFATLLTARFTNKWYRHLWNGLLLALSHAPRLLLAWIPWAAAIVLTFYNFDTMYSMILVWLMAGFSALGYAAVWVLYPVIEKLEGPKETE